MTTRRLLDYSPRAEPKVRAGFRLMSDNRAATVRIFTMRVHVRLQIRHLAANLDRSLGHGEVVEQLPVMLQIFDRVRGKLS